jgi:hypothetical protein
MSNVIGAAKDSVSPFGGTWYGVPGLPVWGNLVPGSGFHRLVLPKF